MSQPIPPTSEVLDFHVRTAYSKVSIAVACSISGGEPGNGDRKGISSVERTSFSCGNSCGLLNDIVEVRARARCVIEGSGRVEEVMDEMDGGRRRPWIRAPAVRIEAAELVGREVVDRANGK